jgi:opacity protein-like surface antigen
MSNAAFVRYAHAFLISFMWWVLLSSSAFAEMYVAGMAGYTVPNDLTNIKGTGGASALSLSNLELQNSVAYGGTIGLLSPKNKMARRRNRGLQYDPSCQAAARNSFRFRNECANRDCARLAGVGLGVFFAKATFQGQSDSDTVPGLNALAGLRVFATDHLAIFAEYKYNRAAFSLPHAIGFEADYSANIVMGGLSYHF